MPKKFTIQTTMSMKFSTGNWETLDCSKTMSTEIECDPAELPEKSSKMDAIVILLLKNEAEAMMKELGRTRIMKMNGADTPVELWKSYVGK